MVCMQFGTLCNIIKTALVIALNSFSFVVPNTRFFVLLSAFSFRPSSGGHTHTSCRWISTRWKTGPVVFDRENVFLVLTDLMLVVYLRDNMHNLHSLSNFRETVSKIMMLLCSWWICHCAASVCTTGTLVLKDNEGRLSVWLLHVCLQYTSTMKAWWSNVQYQKNVTISMEHLVTLPMFYMTFFRAMFIGTGVVIWFLDQEDSIRQFPCKWSEKKIILNFCLVILLHKGLYCFCCLW